MYHWKIWFKQNINELSKEIIKINLDNIFTYFVDIVPKFELVKRWHWWWLMVSSTRRFDWACPRLQGTREDCVAGGVYRAWWSWTTVNTRKPFIPKDSTCIHIIHLNLIRLFITCSLLVRIWFTCTPLGTFTTSFMDHTCTPKEISYFFLLF